MDLKGKKVLVFGTGISGIAAAKLLTKYETEIILFDGNTALDVEQLDAKLEEVNNYRIVLGELPKEEIAALDLVVLSPGVPTDLPLVETMKREGIRIWGEIELAYQCGKGAVLAITGTNGKTTTTALLGQIMNHVCDDVKVVGNIGTPYTSLAAEMTKDTVTVAEISSFQLETIQDFCPKVSAILNITPDHLNRHHTMENYINAKLDITRNQGKEQTVVLNYEDSVLRQFGMSTDVPVVFFSSKRALEQGLYLDGTDIVYADGEKTEVLISVDELNILGAHNYENVMAASAMAICFGVAFDDIRAVLRVFQAVEHRIEYVTEKRGVRFYNDSKGTNPDAAIKGIEAMNRPTLLIGGGYDKQSSYGDWIDSFAGKVKKLVLIGQTREKIAEEAKAHGFTQYVFADTLEEAITICYENAVEGDAVLLSPACASWGMFPNYEVRGKIFKEFVLGLKE